jgi:uncharacterized membrane protein (DUF2068 family)
VAPAPLAYHPRVPEIPSLRRIRPIRFIAVFKLFKAAMSVLAGLGALQFLKPGSAAALQPLLDLLATHADLHALRQALVMFSALSPHRIEVVAAAAFLYAGLCIVEGLGLWWEKRWVEYVVVIATTSALPFELAALLHRPSLTRLTAVLLNGAVAVYLFRALRKPGTRS